VHHGSGKIEKVDPDEVTISHGPIPSLRWGPMTMGFVPPAAGLPPGLKAGNEVDFDLRARPDGRYEITGVRPLPPAAQPGGHDHTGHDAGGVQ
jgi:Cu(I)/Ag(I) efflux system membrane fusion protein